MSKITSFLPAAALAFAALAFSQPAAGSSQTYGVTQKLTIGGAGGWDYITVDSAHKLLFVPRVTHTMVIDAVGGAVVADIPGQTHNHGAALAPGAGRGFITDGDEGSVTVFDLKTYAVLGKIKAEADADGIIYDPTSNKILVVCGDSGVLVPISPDVDPSTGKADPSVDLGGKPEFLVVDGRGMAYINLEDKDQVAVVDTKTMKVVNHWSTAPGGSPVGMSMDPEKRRLYIGCRKPQKLIVMSADDGKVLADLPIGAGVDATVFDGDAFASCRDGTLAVARETSPLKFEIVQTVATPPVAKTMGIDSETHILYLPTAEFLPPDADHKRPAPKPDSFMIVVVKPTGTG